MVTICTASLTFNNSTFCPHSVFMCFVWISEQTAIISLYNINWLEFITQTESVYCAVRTGYLNNFQDTSIIDILSTPYVTQCSVLSHPYLCYFPNFARPYHIISVMSIDLHVSRNFSLRNNVHCLSFSYLVDCQRKYLWTQNSLGTVDP